MGRRAQRPPGSALTIAVVGAGVTGLAAAFLLRRAGRDVVLLEAEARPGGVVRTEAIDGFTVERGPESIRGGPPAVGRLLDALRLRDRVVGASAASSARLLLHDGRLVALPSGPLGLLRLPFLSRRGALRLLAEPLVRRPRHVDPEESLYALVRRRLGRRAADALLDPVIGGIYGGDPSRIEAASGMSRLVRWEGEHGSLLRGAIASGRESAPPKGSFTFPGGMERLIDALAAAVGPDLHLGDPVAAIRPRGGGWRLETAGGGRFDADRVLITSAPETLPRWFPQVAPPALPRAPVAAIHLGYRPADVPGGLPGFGWLAHSRERRDVLGCLWVSGTFPGHAPAGHHLVRVMTGGARDPERVGLPDEAHVAHARRVLREVQGVEAEPVLTHVARALPGIPQYPRGWKAFLDRPGLPPGIELAGWFYGGIGVADGVAAAEAWTARITGT